MSELPKGRIEFDDPTFRRSEVVSPPGAAIEVTRFNLTDAERCDLSINIRLSDLSIIPSCPECGHDRHGEICNEFPRGFRCTCAASGGEDDRTIMDTLEGRALALAAFRAVTNKGEIASLLTEFARTEMATLKTALGQARSLLVATYGCPRCESCRAAAHEWLCGHPEDEE